MEIPRFCELCDATGLVTIYNPLDVRAIRQSCDGFLFGDGTKRRAGVRDNGLPLNALSAVPCKCLKGDRFALWFDARGKVEPMRLARFGESTNHVRPVRTEDHPFGDIISDVESTMQPIEWEF